MIPVSIVIVRSPVPGRTPCTEDLPSTLETVDTQKVDPELDSTLCVANGCALVQNNASSLLQL